MVTVGAEDMDGDSDPGRRSVGGIRQPQNWGCDTRIKKPRGRSEKPFRVGGSCIGSFRVEMTVFTVDGNFERPRGSVSAIHNALKYPDNTLLLLSDLRGVRRRRSWVLEMVTKSKE